MRQAIIWTNDGIVYRRIYALVGFNELKSQCFVFLEGEKLFRHMARIYLSYKRSTINKPWISSLIAQQLDL